MNEPEPLVDPTPAPSFAGRLFAGWRPALLYGMGTFVAVLLLGQVTTARILQAGTSQTLWQVIQRGIEGFFLLNPAGLRLAGPAEVGFDVVLRVDLLLGSGVAVFLLYRGGRKVAERAGTVTSVGTALHGAKVAVPYAVLSFALSYGLSLTRPSPVLIGGSPLSTGDVTYSIPHLLAFAGPLLMAAAAGFAGGLFADRDRLTAGPWGRRSAAVLAGGWRMLVTALGLAFVGILIVLAADAAVRHGYVDAFHSGFGRSPFVMSVPNQALFVLVPAMGGCIGVYSKTTTVNVLCYGHFPLASGGFGVAPSVYFAFALVPLVATISGGMAAARTGVARSRSSGALFGAGAGVAFALLLVVVNAVASPALRGLFASQAVQGYAGGRRLDVAALGLAWGVLGGALGGLLASRQSRSKNVPANAAAPAASAIQGSKDEGPNGGGLNT